MTLSSRSLIGDSVYTLQPQSWKCYLIFMLLFCCSPLITISSMLHFNKQQSSQITTKHVSNVILIDLIAQSLSCSLIWSYSIMSFIMHTLSALCVCLLPVKHTMCVCNCANYWHLSSIITTPPHLSLSLSLSALCWSSAKINVFQAGVSWCSGNVPPLMGQFILHN